MRLRLPRALTLPSMDALLRRAFEGTRLRESRRAQRAVHRAMRALHHPALPVWYHPAYRLPVPTFEAVSGGEPRRTDFVAWFLLDAGLLRPDELRTPQRVSYRDLARVHPPSLLDRVNDPELLARVFATTPAELRPDEVLRFARLACGGTLAAAREARQTRRPALNLAGGFHHAEPDKPGGYCLVNDLAVAIAALRAEGFEGRVVVLDLDAHPPDGTAACLEHDPRSWIGSISGVDWGPLPGAVDEVVIPGAGDEAYLAALDALLWRMPAPALAFVIAGGDVLAGDRHGGLALTLRGARTRDERVAAALAGVGSVWLPGGGYHPDAWRLLAGTALVLAQSPVPHVPGDYDPMDRRFTLISRTLRREDLGDAADFDMNDVAEELRLRAPRRARFLDFYTAEGLEMALERYGVLEHLRRLGYDGFGFTIDATETGDRARLCARAGGREHLLIELVAERRVLEGQPVLYVHWLTLRDPLAPFDRARPRLPGQEVPGLGLAREFSVMLGRMAERLGLEGVAFAPSHFHTAYAAREHARFASPERQGRFEALHRDLRGLPLLELTRAVAEGRVRCNGEPYRWEPSDMVYWMKPHPWDEAAAEREAGRCRFEVAAAP